GHAVAQCRVAGAEMQDVGVGAAAHDVVAAGGDDDVGAIAGAQHVVAVVADAGRQVGNGRMQVVLVEQGIVDVALGDGGTGGVAVEVGELVVIELQPV